jgi:HAMP domain-containing protein
MADSNEIEALKASFRGALSTAAALAALEDRVLALDPRADIPAEDLDELGRVTLAHAVSSQALRGLIESIRARRT